MQAVKDIQNRMWEKLRGNSAPKEILKKYPLGKIKEISHWHSY